MLKVILKLFRRHAPKSQWRSESVQESFERHEKTSEFWKNFIVISLICPTIYYLFYYHGNKKVTDIGPFSETILIDEPEFVTERNQIVKHQNYEKDPFKLFKVNINVADHTKDEQVTQSHGENKLPLCTVTVTGNVTVHKVLKEPLEDLYPMVKMGGYYKPTDCRPRNKVAILVPFRDRHENLKVFLYNIHPFLMRQRIEYRIYVFEQSGTALFNKGRLFNAGFLEIQKNREWECIIFHDVDLLPTNDLIRYSCPKLVPRHMCATVAEKEKIPNYKSLFGGVTAMTMWQYKKANGYSNMYWGWGGEDNDMFLRLRAAGLGVVRYRKSFARYVSLNHPKRDKHNNRFVSL